MGAGAWYSSQETPAIPDPIVSPNDRLSFGPLAEDFGSCCVKGSVTPSGGTVVVTGPSGKTANRDKCQNRSISQ